MDFEKINREKSWNFVSDLKYCETKFSRAARAFQVSIHPVYHLKICTVTRLNGTHFLLLLLTCTLIGFLKSVFHARNAGWCILGRSNPENNNTCIYTRHVKHHIN